MSGSGPFSIFCESEQALLQGYADELASIGQVTLGERGPDGQIIPAMRYYQRDRSQHFDPVYQEPSSDEIWRGPYRMPATLEWADDLGNYDFEAEESGVDRVFRAEMSITVTNWTEYVINAHDPAFQAPAEGDVVCFYDKIEKCYSVNKVSRAGYTSTSNHHVEWKLELVARRSFNPDRLLSPKLRQVEEP